MTYSQVVTADSVSLSLYSEHLFYDFASDFSRGVHNGKIDPQMCTLLLFSTQHVRQVVQESLE